jgi:hypothetical protein
MITRGEFCCALVLTHRANARTGIMNRLAGFMAASLLLLRRQHRVILKRGKANSREQFANCCLEARPASEMRCSYKSRKRIIQRAVVAKTKSRVPLTFAQFDISNRL